MMTKKLSAAFVGLVYEALLKSFWRRKALWRFLRQGGIAEGFLATWSETESKRDFLDRLFAELPRNPGGQDRILVMARDLAEQDTFPDLTGWEDSELKLAHARKAITALRDNLSKLDNQVRSEAETKAAQKRFRAFQEEVRRSRKSLDTLSSRLNTLASALGTQQAGYDFQTWFYDLMDFFEIESRRPYLANLRQIDGSITVSGTTYLVELKFSGDQTGVDAVDSLARKVHDKADNTMGILLSISGFSATAIAQASGPRTTLLLFDHQHLYLALSGALSFQDLVERVRRHASQTGEAFLSPGRFGD